MKALVLFFLLINSAWAGEIKPYQSGSLSQILSQNAGKPLLVHFWSINCPPCVAHLPAWKKILAANPGLRVIFVSTDPLEQKPGIIARLKKNGLDKLENYAFADEFPARLYFEAAPDWRGELPFNLLVSSQGKKESETGHLENSQIIAWMTRIGATQN